MVHSLYILQPGGYLRKDGDSLRIEKNGQLLEIIPATGLSQLALAGRTSISGAILDFLIHNKIETVFMIVDGRSRARLLLHESGHVSQRQQQYIRLANKAYALQLAHLLICLYLF